MSSVATVTLMVQLSIPGDQPIVPSVLRQIQESTTRFGNLLVAHAQKATTSPGELRQLEQDLHTSVPRECVGSFVGAVIRAAVEDPVVRMKANSLLDLIPHARLQKNNQKVTLDLLGGGKATVYTPYCLRRPPDKRGRPRKKGGRGKAGNGIYPALAVLGIHERLTPAYASLVAQEVVRGSLDEAQATLASRGVERDRKSIQRVVRIVSRRALAYQKKLAEGKITSPRPAMDLKGKRIGICIDGGKIRTRAKKRGRRRKSGGKSFTADWKEPRVWVVYELDAKGRKRRRGFARYDAGMVKANEAFARLAVMLQEMGAQAADQWVIAGDGALWIWERNRMAKLIDQVGYDPAKVVEVVDFYHATEYLSEFASLRSGCTDKDREKWVRGMKRLLRNGRVDKVIEAMEPLCQGRNKKKLATVVRRFERNKHRMRYRQFRKAGIPCGSGVVESAVRRIVNLRLKGPGIFWKIETAEGLLHLRARYLSGDWEDYLTRIFEPEELWCRESCSEAELLAA